MRASSLACLLIILTAAAPARALAEPLAETLVGTWTCQARENSGAGGNDIAMTLTYRRSGHFLVGEIVEDNGAALLDVWLDSGSGAAPLSLRRVISYDASIEMELVEEAPTWMKLEGEMRHTLGTTAKVREEFRFTGTEEFRALWEADSGEGWKLIMDRTCKRL
ncbi:hypothetical protein [Pelagibius marinus]|uniref:hypothetical protein n=1 Tax=Pelagibius marinus TaxID=2762760 RepID=UPI0018726873|nr:hypothetical protein [Pelagibius marinus]